ncbi:hypothetical protein CspHIS471_0103600 [Cutaneotrichosporon sp. HIS471]|nr:hypothetical protein CspHIS471_0103600 [Cutaneotrichosporon sp. HIS471]
MQSSQSSPTGSSLLHLCRPAQLKSTPPSNVANLEVLVCEDSNESVTDSVCSSPTSVRFFPRPAPPSLKVDTLSGLPRQYPLRRGTSDTAYTSSTTSSASTSLEQVAYTAGLRSSDQTALVAKPQSEWQRDEDTALCSHPFCSTMFSQTTLSIGPRRHHCRLCGLVYCGQHSTGRLPLETRNSKDQIVVRSLRVCDGCCAITEDDSVRRPSECAPSLTSSSTSAFDDELLASPHLFPVRSMNRSPSQSAVDELEPRLAPLEEWMGGSGILSLYPLAVTPSHSKRPASRTTQPAVGPLFAPTLSERRTAREKQLQRQSRRRMWVSTPVTSDVESNDEGDSSGWSLPNGESGTRLTQEREVKLEWSTF